MASARNMEPIPARFAGALGLGAVTGGVLTSFWFVASVRTFDLALVAIVLPFAAAVWMYGLLFIGFPLWVVLHERGYRSPRAAVGLGGAVLTPVLFLGREGVGEMALAAGFVLIGPAVGWVVWRTAYGRSRYDQS